ncbi:hypothetical protein PAEPH01_1257 [Pancytospora epiphaga]|nr:hypothetical protein PAEPH01_1257 [Pancytospora epiphaga]
MREFAAQYPPMSMSDIARQLQVAQLCYEEATVKERKPSSLRSDIEKKISDNTTSKALVERNVAGETLPVKELTKARRCMRSLNLILELKCDFQKAINILDERIRVYTSKITNHASRCTFRTENRCFELFRKRFYRRLFEENPVEHNVKQEEIKAFWSTIWNHREGDNSKYDEYLEEFVLNYDGQSIFPSVAEVNEVIKHLPNWKAAGPDGVYNFFIKKCTSLHLDIYCILGKICLEGYE